MHKEIIKTDYIDYYFYLPNYQLAIYRVTIQGIFYYEWYNTGRNSSWRHPIDTLSCEYKSYNEISITSKILTDKDDFLVNKLNKIELYNEKFKSHFFQILTKLHFLFGGVFAHLGLNFLHSAKCRDNMGKINSALNEGRKLTLNATNKYIEYAIEMFRNSKELFNSPLVLPMLNSNNFNHLKRIWAKEVYYRIGISHADSTDIDNIIQNYSEDSWEEYIAKYLIEKDYPRIKRELTIFSDEIEQLTKELEDINQRWVDLRGSDNTPLILNGRRICINGNTINNVFPAIENDTTTALLIYGKIDALLSWNLTFIEAEKNMALMSKGKEEYKYIVTNTVKRAVDIENANNSQNSIKAYYAYQQKCRPMSDSRAVHTQVQPDYAPGINPDIIPDFPTSGVPPIFLPGQMDIKISDNDILHYQENLKLFHNIFKNPDIIDKIDIDKLPSISNYKEIVRDKKYQFSKQENSAKNSAGTFNLVISEIEKKIKRFDN